VHVSSSGDAWKALQPIAKSELSASTKGEELSVNCRTGEEEVSKFSSLNALLAVLQAPGNILLEVKQGASMIKTPH